MRVNIYSATLSDLLIVEHVHIQFIMKMKLLGTLPSIVGILVTNSITFKQCHLYIRLVHLDVEVRTEELLAPALLCHKEPARAFKAPY